MLQNVLCRMFSLLFASVVNNPDLNSLLSEKCDTDQWA